MTRPLKLLMVAGARPNFMKVAPMIREVIRRGADLSYSLVHTGQHYDESMSDVFFSGLGIPTPDHHLEVGSGSHARQTAAIMVSFEPVLEAERPACVVVFGDVNSTLACSVVAKKMQIPVAHVEAGLRSGDLTMPEEINRIVTDSISDYFFVTEESGVENLLREGKPKSVVHHVGHVMIDNLYYELDQLDRISKESISSTRLVQDLDQYGVITLHRPSNVDDGTTLRAVISALGEVSTRLPLVFPVHPRTKASLERHGISLPERIIATEPLGYREFLNVWRGARLVLTDSGGLQEETTALGIPCLTLRENTERPVTITNGSNVLVGADPSRILGAAQRVLNDRPSAAAVRKPLLWDGKSSERILDVLEASL